MDKVEARTSGMNELEQSDTDNIRKYDKNA